MRFSSEDSVKSLSTFVVLQQALLIIQLRRELVAASAAALAGALSKFACICGQHKHTHPSVVDVVADVVVKLHTQRLHQFDSGLL
jgi:hypothetical protein